MTKETQFKAAVNQDGEIKHYKPKEQIRTNYIGAQHSYDGGLLVVNEAFPNSQRKTSGSFTKEVAPEEEFERIMYLVKHDPRLSLAEDTYVQLVMGAGLTVTASDEKLQAKLQKWITDIDLERKMEDGLHSAVSTGNMFFEKAPLNSDLVEIDVTTMTKVILDDRTTISKYVQTVNNQEIALSASEIMHFKMTNTNLEIYGRGIFHSIVTVRDGNQKSAVEAMQQIEGDMVKIFDSYASPLMMLYFEDAGEDWIKKQQSAFKNIKPGAKIVTDKKFEAETFEVNPASKFDKYIEHMQQNNIEVGSQFPLQFFNGGFTARAASETTDSVLIRKVKRIQKRLSDWLKEEFIVPYALMLNKNTDPADIHVSFDFESKSDLSVMDVEKLFEKGVLNRSEVRAHLIKHTNVQIDEADMEDELPITSVTPTDRMRDDVEPIPQRDGDEVDAPKEESVKLDEILEAIKEKIPKPRGRPRKTQETIATLPDILTIDDLKNRIREIYTDMPEEEIKKLAELMSPMIFTKGEQLRDIKTPSEDPVDSEPEVEPEV